MVDPYATLELAIDVHKAERIAGLPELLRSAGFVPMPVELRRNKVTNQTFRPSASFMLRDSGGALEG